jgi:hypothetical protein
MKKSGWFSVAGLLAMAMILAACQAVSDGIPSTGPTASNVTIEPVFTQTQPEAPEPTRVRPTLTPENTPTPPIPTPKRPEFTTEVGSRYTAEQMQRVESGAFADQEEALRGYYQYWMNAANQVVYPPNPGDVLNIEYIFDPANPAKACLAIPATGYENADMLAVPYRNGEPQSVAPAQYANGQIETGQGPLLLTKSGLSSETGQPYVLSCENNLWVRRDASGVVMERVNRQGQWEVEPAWLAGHYNLNPAHQYSIVTVTNEDGIDARYLRDEHNQAYMRMYQAPQPGENPAEVERWVDTSLEEKYGHLAPVGQSLYYRIGFGNLFPDSMELAERDRQMTSRSYRHIGILAYSTGDLQIATVFDPDLNRDVTRVTGPVVYRDRDNNPQILNVLFEAVDPTFMAVNLPTCRPNTPGDLSCPAQNIVGDGRTYIAQDWVLDTEIAYWNQPGRPLFLQLMLDRPDITPPLVTFLREDGTPRSSNIRNLAVFYMWQLNRDLYAELEASIVSGSGVNPHPELIYGFSAVRVYMDDSETRSLMSPP